MNKTITLSLLFAVIASSSNAQTSADVEKAIKFEKYDVAKKDLYTLIKIEPNEGRHFYDLGKIHLIQNHSDSASFYFKNGLRAKKNPSINNIGLGELALNQNKEKEARSKFNGAQVGLKRNDISSLLLIAQACLDSKNPDIVRATEFANKAVKMQPKSIEAKVMLGDVYLADKSSKLALSTYREALEINPKSPLALMKVASVSIYNKDYAVAVDLLNKIVEENPNYEPVYKELAKANYLWNKVEKDSNKMQNAVAAYTKYHELIGDSFDSDNNYADFLVRVKDFKTLDSFTKQKWNVRGDNFSVYKYASIAALENGNNADAIAFINKYFEVIDDKSSFKGLDYFYLGLAEIANAKGTDGLYEKTAYTKGLENIKTGLNIDKSLAEEMNSYAMNLFEKQNYEQAYYLFDLGTLDKESVNYVYDSYYKGNCLFLTRDTPMFSDQLQKAATAFQDAIKVSPSTHEAQLLNARTNRYINTPSSNIEMEKSYEAFVNVLNTKKMLNDPDYKDALIEAYMFIGSFNADKNKDKAKTYLNKVLEIDPSHEFSLKTLKKVSV